MTRSRGIGGLSDDEKDQLLANTRATRLTKRTRKAPPQRRSAASDRAPKAFDFSELEAFKQLRMQKAAADMIGIENPFFRPHAAIAADTTLIGNQRYINFASYNYLGLNGHPKVSEAARNAIEIYGTSVSASRIVAGERPLHRELEQALASFHGVEDAVVMVSGHATNVTTIGQMLGPEDLIICDALIHNSIVEGARLSGATRLMYPHNDLEALDRLLIANRERYRHTLIAVEGLYSMDGDYPDLPTLIELKQRHGAWLLVDEAHSVGVLGATGHGIAEYFDINPNDVEMWMGTLSKTMSACGGYIAGSSALVEFLKVSAPGFVYSVGMSPPVAAAALASVQVLLAEPERVDKLKENGHLFVECAKQHGLDTGYSAGYSVVPVIVGGSVQAAMLSNRLHQRQINALPIIFPAVAEKAARLRFFITCDHTEQQIRDTVAITAEELENVRAEGSVLSKLSGLDH